jgi:hypothetical protein
MSDDKHKTTETHNEHSDSGHHAVKMVKPKPIQIQQLGTNQVSYSTWMLLIGLVFAFVILKTFIYIKDEKRHGK